MAVNAEPLPHRVRKDEMIDTWFDRRMRKTTQWTNIPSNRPSS